MFLLNTRQCGKDAVARHGQRLRRNSLSYAAVAVLSEIPDFIPNKDNLLVKKKWSAQRPVICGRDRCCSICITPAFFVGKHPP